MKDLLKKLQIESRNAGTFDGTWINEHEPKFIPSYSPIDGKKIAELAITSAESYERVITAASENFRRWSILPAPQRGEIVRQIGNEFRRLKQELAKLITIEMGKIVAEAEGEIQEVIDIADFAVGLSRQLYGNTMHSERPQHRMYEQWHPLGSIGVITAFNFPAAVWAWNAMIAAVCGNSVVWKPSEETPVTAFAIVNLCHQVAKAHGFPALFTMMIGDGPSIGQKMAADSRFPLISATGSSAMGKSVGQTVGARLGRSLLELGGNNAIIITEDANLDLAKRAVVFGAVGTAGQRCTSTRRVIIHQSIQDKFTESLARAYQQIPIGSPLESSTLMGPLINQKAVEIYRNALSQIKLEGGKVVFGGNVLHDYPGALYVEPTIVLANKGMKIISTETFAPILYIIPYQTLDEAIEIQNNVPQGLSSAIFTNSLITAEHFLSCLGSDCGIANVNIGTSGAEIGGAFGGEKETGGGREAGSDSWKVYMRRQTNTINWSSSLPLAQGINFS